MRAYEARVGMDVMFTGDEFNVDVFGSHDYRTRRLRNGFRGQITRVGSESILVRWYYNDEGQTINAFSAWMYAGHIDPTDESVAIPGGRRALGTKPEDTEDMTYIGIDHPGIQWLWDDLGRYATNKSWCPQYDDLARKVGIPGRPQDFRITHSDQELGISTTFSIRARSQLEAQEEADKRWDAMLTAARTAQATITAAS